MVRVHVAPESGARFEAFTVDISPHGALILCPRSLEPGSKVQVTNTSHGIAQTFRVVRHGHQFGWNHEIGVEMLHPFLDFWGAAYRPTP